MRALGDSARRQAFWLARAGQTCSRLAIIDAPRREPLESITSPRTSLHRPRYIGGVRV
jgi:hypothetical protein